MPQIGPWTVQCLGLFGRNELDSLPAGDLAYIKLVGRLRGDGRRATIPEVEEFYAPYEPYRGPGRARSPSPGCTGWSPMARRCASPPEPAPAALKASDLRPISQKDARACR